MSAGHDSAGNKIDLISVFEGVGARAAGTIGSAISGCSGYNPSL